MITWCFFLWRCFPGLPHAIFATPTLGSTLLHLEGLVPTSSPVIYDFHKSVKCSISDYRCQHFITTTWSHNLDNILNLKYAPMISDGKALLDEQKNGLFSAFSCKSFFLLIVLASSMFILTLEMQGQSIFT
jgi:hypothetical protein